MSLSNFYTHTVSIQRLTQTDDDYGGQTNEWETSVSSYSCRIYSTVGEFSVKDVGGYQGRIQKLIGGNTDILENDKVISGTDEYIVKKVYKVWDKDSIHHIECQLDKVKK